MTLDTNFNRQELLLERIRQRKNFLINLIKSKEASLKSAPEGSLRILKRRHGCQYYYRTNPNDTNGKYIPKEKRSLAYRLAQRDYDQKVLYQAKKELSIIDEYERYLNSNTMADIYEKMTPFRKELIKPVALPNDTFAKCWLAEYYEPMGFDSDSSQFYSENNIRVRSKSELMIANMLERRRIPYRYEYPIKLKGNKMVRPDFTCLNVRTGMEYIWEHYGMMDNIAYANNNVNKINVYVQNGFLPGINMIMTYESSQFPINTNIIKTMIDNYLI